MKTFEEVQQAATEFIKTKQSIVDAMSNSRLDFELMTAFGRSCFSEGYIQATRETIKDLKPQLHDNA